MSSSINKYAINGGGVCEGVTVGVGVCVLVTVGVTVFVGVILGVIDIVGVILGVIDIVGVILGVIDIVGVIDGVGVGVKVMLDGGHDPEIHGSEIDIITLLESAVGLLPQTLNNVLPPIKVDIYTLLQSVY
jgi:hypothetical protein